MNPSPSASNPIFPEKNRQFPALTDPTRDPLPVVGLEEFRIRSRLN